MVKSLKLAFNFLFFIFKHLKDIKNFNHLYVFQQLIYIKSVKSNNILRYLGVRLFHGKNSLNQMI